MRRRGFAAPTAAVSRSALNVPAWHPCFHQLPACLHHIYVSQLQRIWHRLKHSPLLQYITTLPQRPHSTLLLSKGYPSALEPNSSHVLQERSARLLCASPEKAPTSPNRAKNATNYWGSRRWRLSFNPWQVCFRIWIETSWHLGWRGREILKRAMLHHVLLLCDTEYSSGDHFLYDKEVISFMPQRYAFKSWWPSTPVRTVV